MNRSRWCSLCLLAVCFLPTPLFAAEAGTGSDVNLWMVLPFALLLLSIAILPLTHKEWWEDQYPWVAGVLGIVVVVYYVFVQHNTLRMLHTFIEYFSFVSLLAALFVISGGIHIRMAGKSTPIANTVLLALGAVLANLLGTTGASMLLIRPYLRINQYRVKPYHVVFFIFIVSNIGGALTPIGDPPLFLGYLKGIPFFWVMDKVWHIWLLATGVLLAVFYGTDAWQYRQLGHKPDKVTEDRLVIDESRNFLFLFLILAAVLIQGTDIMKKFPHEVVTLVVACFMLVIAAASYRLTDKDVHKANEFSFSPIIEVAIIFAGIFATMTPALDYMEHHARDLGLNSVGNFYWGTGALSAVLDNAPTYLNYLAAAFGLFGLNIDNPDHVHLLIGTAASSPAVMESALTVAHGVNSESWHYVQAISVAAVFFGAMTYIGNGPNFMVRSIANHAGVKCPSFFGYILKYSLPILLPLFFAVYWIFFRG